MKSYTDLEQSKRLEVILPPSTPTIIDADNQIEIGDIPYLSNHKVQDILDEMGMIDENGDCPYTVEEIFRAGIEWLSNQGITINGDTDDEYVRILEDTEKAICEIAPNSTVIIQVRNKL